MQLVNDLNWYFRLVTDIRSSFDRKRLSTNCFLSQETISCLIEQKRLYWTKLPSGVLFLSDEGRYFRGYYYWDCYQKTRIEFLSKPLLVKNLYIINRKKPDVFKSEKLLKEAGFYKHETNMQVEFPNTEYDKVCRQLQLFKRLLKKGDLSLEYAKPEDYNSILQMRHNTPEFSIFTFSYLSDKEVLEGFRDHSHLAVYDTNRNICACTYIEYTKNKAIGNGLCVKKEYQTLFGLGTVLLLQSIKDTFDKGYKKYTGWVTEDQKPSRQFHESLGFIYTGRMEDDWVLIPEGQMREGLDYH